MAKSPGAAGTGLRDTEQAIGTSLLPPAGFGPHFLFSCSIFACSVLRRGQKEQPDGAGYFLTDPKTNPWFTNYRT